MDESEWQQLLKSIDNIEFTLDHCNLQMKSLIKQKPTHVKSSSIGQSSLTIKYSKTEISESSSVTLTPRNKELLIMDNKTPARYERMKIVERYLHTPPQQISYLSRFKVGPLIGKGMYSQVYKALDLQTNSLVALKVMERSVLDRLKMWRQILREIKIQQFMNHPNILKLYGYFQEKGKIYLILELASQGELFKLMKAQANNHFSEKQAASYIGQVCDAMGYMHDNGLIHRDLKPENILLHENQVKVADFGLSTMIEQNRNSFCGTTDYISPEMAMKQEYDETIDIWSIGVLTYEIMVGNAPFSQKTQKQTLEKIIRGDFTFPSHLSKDAQSFIRQLLKQDPTQRLSFEDLKDNPFLKNSEKKSRINFTI